MVLRIVSIDELQFLTCLKHRLWGSKSNRFKKWNIGDKLVFLIKEDKCIAAFAEIAGESFISNESVWDNGEFQHRIAIKFISVLKKADRVPILQVRPFFMKAWDTDKYGLGILNQLPEIRLGKLSLTENKYRPIISFLLPSR